MKVAVISMLVRLVHWKNFWYQKLKILDLNGVYASYLFYILELSNISIDLEKLLSKIKFRNSNKKHILVYRYWIATKPSLFSFAYER